MDAKELRIGNYVIDKEDGSLYQIPSVSSINGADLMNPIPLTEQWLKDFGFEFKFFDEQDNNVLKLDNIKVVFDNITTFGMWNIPFKEFKRRVQYVHQLQNLYFALTGNELIKQ